MSPEALDRTRTTLGGARRCLACARASGPCAVPMLEGDLIEVNARERRLLLHDARAQGDSGRFQLQLSSAWAPLAADLARVGLPAKEPVRIRAFHLARGAASSYVCGRDSVVVLEPDLLLNITAVDQADYCPRQYFVKRFRADPPSAASVRGNAIHAAFRRLLQRGEVCIEDLEHELEGHIIELALAGMMLQDTLAETEPHLRRLAHWYKTRERLDAIPDDARTETFVLSPEVGLRGRLDALWRTWDGRALLEVKTGGTSKGSLPRQSHLLQVHGYHALLESKGGPERQARSTIVYSGTEPFATGYPVNFTLAHLQKVIGLRNQLACIHLSGRAPWTATPNKCAACFVRAECQRLCSLLDERPCATCHMSEGCDGHRAASAPIAFATLHRQLFLEEQTTELAQRELWTQPVAARVADGHAIAGLCLLSEPLQRDNGEWVFAFACDNHSELRQDDSILLSDGDPLQGEVVSGTITAIGNDRVDVWARERVATPQLLDRYQSTTTFDRLYRSLYAWQQADPRLRALVAGERSPRFGERRAIVAPTLNAEQREAIERGLAAEDYLLIDGPPGTGKTAVIAELVRALAARGQRVLLAAFTNQAVDTMLLRILRDRGPAFVRLGHHHAVTPALHPYLLFDQAREAARRRAGADAKPDTGDVRDVWHAARVVATTTAMWASDLYRGQRFDVAIVDEAAQLTIPYTLAPLGLADRFILVGDDRQLPPIVQSEEATALGLGESLFAILRQSGREGGWDGCVALRRQYRMHERISALAGGLFYDGALLSDAAVAERRLEAPGLAEAMANAPMPSLRAALDPEQPVVFIDTGGRRADDLPGDGRTALRHAAPEEAALAADIVARLTTAGLPAADIGVIAPYRAQVALIHRFLEERCPEAAADVTVDTVERFQGAERAVILLSFAVSAETARNERAQRFVANANRLNVAITRAQRKLILLGDRAALMELPLMRELLTQATAGVTA